MKKSYSIIALVVTLLFVVGVFFTNSPKTVSANPGSVLAGGEWQVYPSTVSSIKVDRYLGYLPDRQLISWGIKVMDSARICHPFNGANVDGWHAEIRQYKNYRWTAISNTEVTRVPNTLDGQIMACADVSAGTYALYAWYNLATESTPVPTPSLTGNSVDGHWTNGVEFDLDPIANPTPFQLQNFSRGVTVSEYGTEICHPFKEGEYGWAGEIREWVDGKWIRVPTTFTRIPSDEGIYHACAIANDLGNYALFAGYSGK